MRFIIQRNDLIKPLQMVASVVERRKTFPILANILLQVKQGLLLLTATDLEVELKASVNLKNEANDGAITVPGKKFVDICRALPEDSVIDFMLQDDRMLIHSGNSRFTLMTLPIDEFPSIDDQLFSLELSLPQKYLKRIIDKTYFSIAQKDVRYFLNGMLLEIAAGKLSAATTDGHRMSVSHVKLAACASQDKTNVIVPRKAVMDLMRLLEDSEENVTLAISDSHLKIVTPDVIFISKLIEGQFPDYNHVIPKHGNKFITLDREMFKQLLARAAILTNEQFRGVCFQLRENQLNVIAHNPEQEEAEDSIGIDYSGSDLDIGFNITYLLDILNASNNVAVQLTFSDADHGVVIEESADDVDCVYVIMPMRL